MSDRILEAAKAAKRLALSVETKFADSRSNGPAPADFGEHEEIPEEAIVPVVMNTDSKVIEEKD